MRRTFQIADWAQNRPYPLARWEASELAKMPTYYVMDRDETMPQTVDMAPPIQANFMPVFAPLLNSDMDVHYFENKEHLGFPRSARWRGGVCQITQWRPPLDIR